MRGEDRINELAKHPEQIVGHEREFAHLVMHVLREKNAALSTYDAAFQKLEAQRRQVGLPNPS